MSQVSLRDATEADVEAIFDLVRQLAEFEEMTDSFVVTIDDFSSELFGPSSPASVIVAELDGAIVGIALYFWTFSTFLGRRGVWLEDLFVAPSARRRGVASTLLAELRRRSPGRVEWEVLDWNEGAIALYDGLGGVPATGWTKYRISPDR